MPAVIRQELGLVFACRAAALVAFAAGALLVIAQRPALAQEAAQDEPAPVKPRVRRGVPGVFIMDADGSNARPLVKMKGMRWHGSPTWSRDGNWVAFDATPEDHGRAEVYLLAVNGPEKGTLKNLGPGNCPTFSPDGGTIAFHLAGGNAAAGEPGVYLMKPDGSERRRLCEGDHPKWSPDGRKLLVTHENVSPAPVYDVVVETGEATRVLESKYAKIPGAVYSPDGGKLAFIGFEDPERTAAELVVMDVPRGATEGGAPAAATKVVHRGRIGWIPNWSHDGKRLVFVVWQTKEGTDHDISHTIDAEGKTPPAPLKDQEGQGTRTSEVEWSPDGKAMVFSSDRPFPADQLAERPDPPASGL